MILSIGVIANKVYYLEPKFVPRAPVPVPRESVDRQPVKEDLFSAIKAFQGGKGLRPVKSSGSSIDPPRPVNASTNQKPDGIVESRGSSVRALLAKFQNVYLLHNLFAFQGKRHLKYLNYLRLAHCIFSVLRLLSVKHFSFISTF